MHISMYVTVLTLADIGFHGWKKLPGDGAANSQLQPMGLLDEEMAWRILDGFTVLNLLVPKTSTRDPPDG